MNHYAGAAAFKQALETRLRSSSASGIDFARLGDSVILKGGLVVELRVERARTTKDIDLRLVGSPTGLLERLRRAAGLEAGGRRLHGFQRRARRRAPCDHERRHGLRGTTLSRELRARRQALRPTVRPRHRLRGPIFGEPDVMTAVDVLGFAGIVPPTLRLYPLETHIAEKLHADTLPRKRPNSRVKDLPDIALLAGVREIEAEDLRGALEQTFTSRKTHALRSHSRRRPPHGPHRTRVWSMKMS